MKKSFFDDLDEGNFSYHIELHCDEFFVYGMQSLSYILFGTSIFGRIIGCILHFHFVTLMHGVVKCWGVCIVIFLY